MKIRALAPLGLAVMAALPLEVMAQGAPTAPAISAEAPAAVSAPAAPVVPAAPAAPAVTAAPAAPVAAPSASTPETAARPATPAPASAAPAVPAAAGAAPAAGDMAATPTADAATPEAAAENPAPEAAAPVAAAQPEVEPAPAPKAHDMSPVGMYHQADIVVKSVMIILAVAAFLTWTVWLFKLVELFFARRRARSAARVLIKAQSLEQAAADLGRRRDPGAFMAQAVLDEYRRSDAVIDPVGSDGVKERAVSIVGRVEAQAQARLRRGMGLLATVGSVSPFVGLFGTVWGIMNSFIGIAETQTTNLAVVAPGIAEALFATAIGLVAAIPAVVIYNQFTRAIAAYKLSLGDAGAAALRLLSRDVDFRQLKGN